MGMCKLLSLSLSLALTREIDANDRKYLAQISDS